MRVKIYKEAVASFDAAVIPFAEERVLTVALPEEISAPVKAALSKGSLKASCGGSELDGMDYIVARKVLKKLESLNVTFVRDEIKSLIEYIEKIFGKSNMADSKAYLTRIQNLY